MNATVLIPWRPQAITNDRVRAWHYVHGRYQGLGFGVIQSDDLNEHPDLFNHGQAYNLAVREATTDVIILGDADTTYSDDRALMDAVWRVESGEWPWALPSRYTQLTLETTRRVLSFELTPGQAVFAEPVWSGVTSWAGIIVVPREAFLAVGGSDERYVGHGADDAALGIKLETLHGPHVRFPGHAVHLWHPRGVQEDDLHRFSGEQVRLTHRYMAAVGDVAAVKEVAGL